MNDPAVYDVFISYASFRGEKGCETEFDRRVSERLQRDLETYRVPRALLNSQPTVPPRLKKVFRDREELHATSDLHESLATALKASRFLVVVCSPRARKSKWMDDEIATFRGMGKGDCILPLLIEGEPAEAFPTALFPAAELVTNGPPAQPLAADIRASTPAKSLRLLKQENLRLLAPILGCKFDDLRQREQERVVRRMTAIITGMVAILAGFAVLSILLFFAHELAANNERIAKVNEKTAKDNEKLANANADKANTEKKRAEANENRAKTQQKLAEDNERDALKNLESSLLAGRRLMMNFFLPRNDLADHAMLSNMAREQEELRKRYPDSVGNLALLQQIYTAHYQIMKRADDKKGMEDTLKKLRALKVPLAKNRIKSWDTPKDYFFPDSSSRAIRRKSLDLFESQGEDLPPSLDKDYIDTVGEYMTFLDPSDDDDRAEARSVLEPFLRYLEKSPEPMTADRLALKQEVINALKRLAPKAP